MISPRFYINARYTLTRFITGYQPYQSGWDMAGLGFSSTFINQINQLDPRRLKLPNISVSGYPSLGGVNSRNNTATDIHEWAANATTIAGSHTLRYGFAYRIYRDNTFNLGSSSGSLSFNADWTRGPLDNSATSPQQLGQSMAAFLYGLPGGSFPISDSRAEQSTVPALFVQDDWKLSRKLTLSLGVRYERPSPVTERFNRSVRGFDFTTASPIQAQAQANYALKPIDQVPVSQFKVLGGLTFAGIGGQPRTLWTTDQNYLMPRFGFAYSVTPRTVLRGGYGIYYDAMAISNVHVNQTGWSRSTDLVLSVDNGQTYLTSLTNPFPGGFLPPLGAGNGLSTNLGQGVSFFRDDLTSSYMQRWQLALQQQLPKNHLVEVSYVANRGTGMRVGRDLNPVPAQYLSTQFFRDNATNSFLTAAVSNPFYPLLPGTGLSGTTVQRSQLLRSYPHFTGVSADENIGYSWYHSMQVRIERRFSAGLNANLSYTWSKMMEAISFLNSTDAMPEEVVSSQDRTHRLALTWLYELPLGRGKPWLNSASPAVSKLVGGWQIQGIFTAQSGAPLGFGNAIFIGDLKNIALPKNQRSPDRWFNTDAGFDKVSANQRVSGTSIRFMPSRFSGIRSDGPNNWDLSIIKNTQFRERFTAQFRAEAINAFNHPQFTPGSVNTTPTSTAFGKTTIEFAWPRVIQFGLKLLF